MLKSQLFLKVSGHSQWLFIVCVWITASVGWVKAEWIRVHLGMASDWFSMSFYFFIPALLWTVSFPVLERICRKFPLSKSSWYNWTIQLVCGVAFAFALKFLALWIDFAIKIQLGMIGGSIFDVLRDVKFLFASAFIDNIAIYWLVILLLHLSQRSKENTFSKRNFPECLLVRTGEGIVKVIVRDISWIEAFGNYLRLFTSKESYCTRGTIKSILPRLNPSDFFRVHRSYVVNKATVHSLKPAQQGRFVIEVQSGKMIPTGRFYRNSVRTLVECLKQ